MREKILILGAETTQAVAIARSLGTRGYDVYVASSSRNSIANFSKFVKGSFLYSSPIESPYFFVKDLLKILSLHNFDLLICTHETNIIPIMFYREDVEKLTNLPLPPNKVLMKVFNKKEVTELAKKLRIPIPKTYFIENEDEVEELAKEMIYPVVIKPQFTAYWDGKSRTMSRGKAKIAKNSYEFSEIVKELKQGDYFPLVQELIPELGSGGIGISTLIDKHQNLKAIFLHRRLKEVDVQGGASAVCESIPIIDELKNQTLKILRELNFWGVSMTEFKNDPRDNTPKLMEINGRFWGSLPLAIYCGVDFPALFVELMLGKTQSTSDSYAIGERMRHSTSYTSRLINVIFDQIPVWLRPHISKYQEVKDYCKYTITSRDYIFSFNDPLPYIIDWVNFLIKLCNSVMKKFRNSVIQISILKNCNDRISELLKPRVCILFVCKGNICRSPFAEYYLKKLIKKYDVHGLEVYSAGLNRIEGRMPPENAIKAAIRFSVDISRHRSRAISKELLKKSDIIFVMDVYEYNYIIKNFPEVSKKIFMLGCFNSKLNPQIPDPYGKNTLDFIKCYNIISTSIDKFFMKIELKRKKA